MISNRPSVRPVLLLPRWTPPAALFLLLGEALAFAALCTARALSVTKYVEIIFFELFDPKTVGILVALSLIGELRASSMPAPRDLSSTRFRQGLLLLHAFALSVFAVLTLLRFQHGARYAFLLIPWRISIVVALAALVTLLHQRLTRPLRVMLSLAVALVATDCYSVFEARAWLLLGQITTNASCAVLRPVFAQLVCTAPPIPNIRTPLYWVSMFPQCSGHEGIALVCLALGLFFIQFRDELRFPRVLVLVPLGILLSWILNVARVVAMVCIGNWISADVARSAFHSYAGSVAFTGLACTLPLFALTSPRFSHRPLELRTLTLDPPAYFLVPFIALALIGIVTAGIGEGGVEWLYAPRMAAGALLLVLFRKHYRALLGHPDYALGIAAGLAIFAAWYVAILRGVTAEDLAFAARLDALSRGSRATWLLGRAFGCILVVPLAEELAFRGYLLRRFTGEPFEHVDLRATTLLAIVVSSLIFGLLHQHWWLATLTAVVLALLARRTGRLSEAVIAHAVANAGLAIGATLSGHWYLFN